MAVMHDRPGKPPKPLYYDREGNPIDFYEWAEIVEGLDRTVENTAVKGGPADVEISTVWMGVDKGFRSDEDRPKVFETMVYGGTFDDKRELYATETEAREGHRRWVEKVKASLI